MNMRPSITVLTSALVACALNAVTLRAQLPSAPPQPPGTSCRPAGFFTAPATYKSVEVLPDRRVTFRLCAPEATSALVTSTDYAPAIPMGFGGPPGLEMSKDTSGLWSGTTAAPFAAGTYRYNFRVNGARVPDPQATRFSEERVGINSIMEVPGPEGVFQAYDPKVAHGAVSTIEYWSTTLGGKRRAHVYTPPGYTNGGATRYPVLYLVHGAGDSDDSWTSVGHAHYILDNLIAAGKAKSMIVVMPFGHTPDKPGADMLINGDFGNDLANDLIPYVEARYRIISGPATRAMAGLSMGGAHTLNFGLPHPERFAWVGIFSMGLGLSDPDQIAKYDAANAAALRRAAKEDRLVYYAVGREDFLYRSIAPTRALLDKYGIKHVYHESGGGHTWTNWREYLADFAPRLFR